MSDVKITIGQTYPLRFDFNSMAVFEEIHGQSVMNVIGSGNLGFLTVRNLIWASLVGVFAEHGKTITPGGVGDLLQKEWIDQDKSFADLTKLVVSAIRESGLIFKPTAEGQKKAPAKKRKQPAST